MTSDPPLQGERERLVAGLARLATMTQVDVRILDAGYEAARGWLGRRARFQVTLASEPSGREVWRDVEVDFSSGSDAICPYFPFTSFVYVGERLAAAAEYIRPEERRTVHLCLKTGSSVEITVATEVSGSVLGDNRELAVLLGQVRAGRIVRPQTVPAAALPLAQDPSSQFLFPLDTAIARPVFVIGAYRSGTSILTWALGQHPNILPVEETRWLQLFGEGARAGFSLATQAARNFFEIYDIAEAEYMAHFGLAVDGLMRTAGIRLNHRTSLARLSGKLAQKDGIFDANFQLARSAFNPKRRWIDGTPENAACVPVLRRLFPAARFLFAIRDPFDVIASMTQFDRAGGDPLTPEEAALMWLRLTNYGLLAYRAYGPDVVRVVRFDDLIGHRAGTLRDIFDFLGEPRFERAGDTFDTRLNSSRLASGERARIVEDLRANLAGRQVVEQLYRQVLELPFVPWEPDEAAVHELQSGSWDTVARIVGQVSSKRT